MPMDASAVLVTAAAYVTCLLFRPFPSLRCVECLNPLNKLRPEAPITNCVRCCIRHLEDKINIFGINTIKTFYNKLYDFF